MQQHEHPQRAVGQRECPVRGRDRDVVADADRWCGGRGAQAARVGPHDVTPTFPAGSIMRLT